jgi:hypothetical protein
MNSPVPGPPPARPTASPPTPRPAALKGAAPVGILIRYLQRTPVRVVGPSTGRLYQFSGSAPLQIVAAQDAQALLRTSLFRKS